MGMRYFLKSYSFLKKLYQILMTLKVTSKNIFFRVFFKKWRFQKKILLSKAVKTPHFKHQKIGICSKIKTLIDNILSLYCQYTISLHIIGKVSQSDFDISSDYSNCPYYQKSWLLEPVLRKHVLFAIEF